MRGWFFQVDDGDFLSSDDHFIGIIGLLLYNIYGKNLNMSSVYLNSVDLKSTVGRMTEQKKELQEKAQPQQNKQEKKLVEYKETLQRLQAEFENYRKRVEKEQAAFQQYASGEVVTQLLPLLDSFSLALSKAEKNETTKGFELIYAQLFEMLEKQGLQKIECVGKKFDPTQHEALMQEEGEEKGVVLEELQKGYMLHDKILRPARVKVSK